MIRSKTFYAMLLALAIMLAIPASGQAAPGPACTAPSAPPPSDINTYLLLVNDHLEVKGGNDGAGLTGFFLGGNIGVNNPGGHLEVGANGRFIMSDNTALVAEGTPGDLTQIGPSQTKVWDVYTKHTTDAITKPNVTVHSGPLCASYPVVSVPPFPTFTAGGADQVFDTGTHTLTPGQYGKIDIKQSATMNLPAGEFSFTSIKLSEGAVLNTHPNTIINVAEGVSAGASPGGLYGSSPLTRWYVRGDGIPAANNVVNFGAGNSTVNGTFQLNGGRFALGQGTTFTGRVWGPDHFKTDFNINMTFAGPDSISGSKFKAANSQSQNGPPLAGFTFYVDVDNDGVFDPGEPSDVSDSNGDWKIDQIYLTGTYNVREEGQPGSTCTFPAGSCSYSVTLGTTGQDHPGKAFGNMTPDCTNTPNLPQCNPPCVPKAGENAQCQPNVTPTCIPKAGQDKNCNTIPSSTDTAKVTGMKGGCGTTSNVRVSGSNISKVTYKIDGKTVKTLKKGPFTYKLKTKDYKVGVHKLRVTTTFKSGKTQVKTLTFQHCRNKQPSFTG